MSADTAENALEALEALRLNDYDLVLMDLQMPVIDGLAAIRAIRSEGSDVRNPEVPVITMTAHALQSDREACVRAGMNGYITKPIRPAELLHELERRFCTDTVAARGNERENVTRTETRIFISMISWNALATMRRRPSLWRLPSRRSRQPCAPWRRASERGIPSFRGGMPIRSRGWPGTSGARRFEKRPFSLGKRPKAVMQSFFMFSGKG